MPALIPLVIAVLLVLPVAAAAEAVDTTTGYTIDFPPEWEVRHGQMGTDILGLTALEGADDDFRENINVVIEQLPPEIDAAAYLAASKDTLRRMMTDFELVAEAPVSFGETAGTRIEYRARMGIYSLHNDVYLVVADGTAYVITLSMLAGDSRARHVEALTAVADSFALD